MPPRFAAISHTPSCSVLTAGPLGIGSPPGVLVGAWARRQYSPAGSAAQTWMMAAAPQARETVSSLFAGVFNAAIALGALCGGLVVDGFGAPAVLIWAAVPALAAVVTVAAGRVPGRGGYSA
jgi:predicted MFS family arabinose efflux permease